ncbi:hypothetical protein [Agrococcus sp. DT81.2]|uniref:hypothetical protein n=1 Tax=Agrococcus sp. DT81.2 TaxID=3393414 RepID=UPI003CE44A59
MSAIYGPKRPMGETYSLITIDRAGIYSATTDGTSDALAGMLRDIADQLEQVAR